MPDWFVLCRYFLTFQQSVDYQTTLSVGTGATRLVRGFDMVDHNILLRRLEHTYQLGGVVLEWFRSYLVGRCQHIRTSSSTSAPAFITCGVPQGSVLSPILFLLYTADLLSLIERHGFIPHLYADDTQILGRLHLRICWRVCLHASTRLRRGCVLIGEHCEDRVSLVHNQPPSSSAAAVTAPGRFWPHSTSFRRSRPWNLHWQRCLDEVSRRENGIGLLLGTASSADYPPVSVEICSSVVGVVSRPLAAGPEMSVGPFFKIQSNPIHQITDPIQSTPP